MTVCLVLLTVLAAALQIVGLLVAAAQLNAVWNQQPEEHVRLRRHLVDRGLKFVWHRLLHQPRHQEVILADKIAVADATAVAPAVTGTIGLNVDDPVPNQLAQLKQETDTANIAAQNAIAEIAVLRAHLDDLRSAQDQQPGRVREGVLSQVRADAAAGVPPAAWGILAVLGGTILQLTISLLQIC